MKTSKCPDVYAWMLERSHDILRTEGRCGMVVPMSLAFSKHFASCRQLLFSGYSQNRFAHFGRIPSALFRFDVRVRNTIHLGYKGSGRPVHLTTRLHRWFEKDRAHLFGGIRYTDFDPDLWEGRIPKINSSAINEAFAKLLRSGRARLGTQTSSCPTGHVLHFKQAAYNWLCFCRRLPPCYDSENKPVPQTKVGRIFFPDEETLKLAMLLANGKLMLVWWFMTGDDFHITRQIFDKFPIGFQRLSSRRRERLLGLFPEMEKAMEANVQFKQNAGKKVGNYNLAKCRHVTDMSDAVFAEALGFKDAWEDMELHYAQTVLTDALQK